MKSDEERRKFALSQGANPDKVLAIEFSDKAQAAAREAVIGEDHSSERYFELIRPFFEGQDMMSANLVSTVFYASGGNLTEVARFAMANKKSETYGPILNWLNKTLIGVDRAVSREDLNDWTAAARMWLWEYRAQEG